MENKEIIPKNNLLVAVLTFIALIVSVVGITIHNTNLVYFMLGFIATINVVNFLFNKQRKKKN